MIFLNRCELDHFMLVVVLKYLVSFNAVIDHSLLEIRCKTRPPALDQDSYFDSTVVPVSGVYQVCE